MFWKDIRVNALHEITTRGVFHHKTCMIWRLETCKHVHQEWVAGGVDHFKDSLLTVQAARVQRMKMSVPKLCREACIWRRGYLYTELQKQKREITFILYSSETPVLFSSSQVSDFARCQEQHYYKLPPSLDSSLLMLKRDPLSH